MQYFVYIGKDSKTINLFSKLSIGVFYAASNCNQAIKVLDKIREKYDTALFFEQINLSQDIVNIHYMRKKYPGLYMVLVIDSLSKEEAPEYILRFSSFLSPPYQTQKLRKKLQPTCVDCNQNCHLLCVNDIAHIIKPGLFPR